ncbi:MAG: MFS transporter [Thermomicrobiales bacterium]
MSDPPVRRSLAFQTLRHRDFRLLWTADCISILGTQIQRTAIVWQVFVLTGSALQLGLLGLFQFLPILFFGLFGGAVADRTDRRHILIGSHIALMVTSALLGLMTYTGHISMPIIYGSIVIASSLNSFAGPARQALIPSLVPRTELTGAATVANLAMQTAAIAGPPLGGFLIGWHGMTICYGADAASFVAVIIAAWRIRTRPAPIVMPQRSLAAIADGFRFLWTTPILLSVMALDFVATFFGSFTTQLPIVAETLLGSDAEGLGLLQSAPAIGAVMGSLVLSVLPIPRRAGLGVILAVLGYGVCVLGFSLSASLPLALLFLAGTGATDAISMAMRQTIRNLVTPDEFRGRIAAAHSTFAMGGPQLGELRAGLIANFTGVPVAIGSGAVATIGCCLIMAKTMPRLRTYRTDEGPVDVVATVVSTSTVTAD